MGCAIASAVFGGIIIICYSISIAVYRDDYWWRSHYESYLYNHDAEMAIAAIILVLGIVEFGIGIWAAILSCFMNPCQCCASQPDQVYIVCLFVCLFICWFFCLSVSICLSVCLSLSVHQSVCVCLSIFPSTCLFSLISCMFVFLAISLSVSVTVCLSVCLSVCQFVSK